MASANKGQLILMGGILVGSLVFVAHPWTWFQKPEADPETVVGAPADIEQDDVQPTAEVTPTETAAPADEEVQEQDPNATPTPTPPPTDIHEIDKNSFMDQ